MKNVSNFLNEQHLRKSFKIKRFHAELPLIAINHYFQDFYLLKVLYLAYKIFGWIGCAVQLRTLSEVTAQISEIRDHFPSTIIT